MAEKFISYTGLQHYDAKIKGVTVGSVSIEGRTLTFTSVSGVELKKVMIPETVYQEATAQKAGLLSAALFTKLTGLAEGATKVEESEANGQIKINGAETVVYDHPKQTKLAAGLYKIETDTTGHVIAGTAVKKADIAALGIPAQDTTYEEATTTVAGLMSAADKAKIDNVSEGATKTESSTTNGKIKVDGAEVSVYTHDTFTAKAAGLYKTTINAEGHVSVATPVTKTDLVAMGLPAQDTTYVKATAEADGLQSKEHFSKVEGIEAGAQVNLIEKVSVNGSPLTIGTGKGVNIDLTDYVKKADVASALTYKGSVDTFAALPAEKQSVGDMYNVKAAWDDAEGHHAAGTNVAWNGTTWDAMATSVVIEPVPNDEIDALFAAA